MKLLSIFNFKDCQRFFLIFLVCFAVFAGSFELFFYFSGETLSLSKVYYRQETTEELYSPKYFNIDLPYKVFNVSKKSPEVIALGTSRVMSLQKKCFSGNENFYNAATNASTGGGLDGMMRILMSFPEKSSPLKKVIISIDPWLFNPNYHTNVPSLEKRFPFLKKLAKSRGIQLVRGRLNAYASFVMEKKNIGIAEVWHKKGIGLNAKVFNAGFRLDGSYQYPVSKKITEEPIKSLDEWEDILLKDMYHFPAAEDLDVNALDKFRDLLIYCREHNIEVIGVLMPFRHDFYNALTSLDSHSLYFDNFRRKIPQMMQEFNFRCYDFSSPDFLGFSMKDFRDIMHFSSDAYDKMLPYMGWK